MGSRSPQVKGNFEGEKGLTNLTWIFLVMFGSHYTQSDSAGVRTGTVQMPIGDGMHIGTTWQNDWTIHVRLQCSLKSNYFDQRFLVVVGLIVSTSWVIASQDSFSEISYRLGRDTKCYSLSHWVWSSFLVDEWQQSGIVVAFWFQSVKLLCTEHS